MIVNRNTIVMLLRYTVIVMYICICICFCARYGTNRIRRSIPEHLFLNQLMIRSPWIYAILPINRNDRSIIKFFVFFSLKLVRGNFSVRFVREFNFLNFLNIQYSLFIKTLGVLKHSLSTRISS